MVHELASLAIFPAFLQISTLLLSFSEDRYLPNLRDGWSALSLSLSLELYASPCISLIFSLILNNEIDWSLCGEFVFRKPKYFMRSVYILRCVSELLPCRTPLSEVESDIEKLRHQVEMTSMTTIPLQTNDDDGTMVENQRTPLTKLRKEERNIPGSCRKRYYKEAQLDELPPMVLEASFFEICGYDRIGQSAFTRHTRSQFSKRQNDQWCDLKCSSNCQLGGIVPPRRESMQRAKHQIRETKHVAAPLQRYLSEASLDELPHLTLGASYFDKFVRVGTEHTTFSGCGISQMFRGGRRDNYDSLCASEIPARRTVHEKSGATRACSTSQPSGLSKAYHTKLRIRAKRIYLANATHSVYDTFGRRQPAL